MSVIRIYMASFYTATRFNASPASVLCKLFDTLMVILKDFFQIVDFEKKKSEDEKKAVCKELSARDIEHLSKMEMNCRRRTTYEDCYKVHGTCWFHSKIKIKGIPAKRQGLPSGIAKKRRH